MKIAVLVSGGVDSSVALNLLKEDRRNKVIAFYIKIWMEDKFSYLGKCPWQEDLKFVEEICEDLKVPLEIVSLQKEYWRLVVERAIAEVRAGRTPNPDILCNQRIKFGVFYDYFGKKFDRIATGHYARLEDAPTAPIKLLRTSPDRIKDQTYFLALLSQQQLSKAMFPIGHLTKNEVRQLACKYDLPNKNRPDSQGICFLGKLKYSDFIREHLGVKKGDIIDKKTGKKMGEHNGFWYYTIGQRQGIKLAGGPWYVVGKVPEKNIIYIASTQELAKMARNNFSVGNLHWVLGERPHKNSLDVKVRHGQKRYKSKVKFIKDKLEVKMNIADSGLAAGQYAIFYDKDICLGGGVIQ